MHSCSGIENRFLRGVLIATGLSLSIVPARAADEDTQALARAAQNPVAAVISLPFQSNTNFNIGPYERTNEVLNVQPVIPVSLTDEWNLIVRVIVPFIYQPNPAFRSGGWSGLGDLNPTFFLSPAKASKFVWGIGPSFTLPTASSEFLGSEKWSVGPAAVGLVITGPWVIGALVNHQWSFAGDKNRERVDATVIQPFVNYNFPNGWYLTSSPVLTANWNAPPDTGAWTIPIGGGAGKVFRVAGHAMNAQLAGYYIIEKPTEYSSDWQLRAQLTFLFPR